MFGKIASREVHRSTPDVNGRARVDDVDGGDDDDDDGERTVAAPRRRKKRAARINCVMFFV